MNPTDQAFPVRPSSYAPGNDGLLTLAYFAARAPHAIPDWFEPVTESKPPDAPHAPDIPELSPTDYSGFIANRLRDIRIGDEDGSSDAAQAIDEINQRFPRPDGTPRLTEDDCITIHAYSVQCEEWREARDQAVATRLQWDRERERQRVAQWPWAWAHLVIAAAEGA